MSDDRLDSHETITKIDGLGSHETITKIDGLGSHETITKIDGLTLEDSNLGGTSIYNIDNSIQDYSVHDSEKLEISGSRNPSDNVINAVPPISEMKESSTQGDSTKQSQEEKPVKRIPAVRAKVPFEKGYSQMDWLKLTRTALDLAGLKGQSNRRLISIDEVRQHNTEGSVWTVLKGCVFNISPYMKFHPGGEDMLMKAAGKDCTSLFNKYHAWVNAEFLLEKCLVGFLDASEKGISSTI